MTNSHAHGIDEAVSSITTSLLNRAKARQKEAWDRLVDLYSPSVYRWCRRAGLDAEESRDIGQEVFLAVWKSLDGFRRDREQGTFLGWLHTITANKIRDHWRKQKGQPNGQGGSDAAAMLKMAPAAAMDISPNPENRALFIRILEFARQRIDSNHWEIFWRVVVEGQTAADVAAELRVERHYIYNIKSRTLKLLREMFTETDIVNE